MKHAAMLFLVGAACVAPGGASAQTCEERLGDVEAQLDEAAELSISASSGGQGVAGSREAQAMELVNEGEELEEAVVPYQEDEEEAVERAEEAGEGGDFVMQAQAHLEQARASAEAGDEAACEAALTEAVELLDEYEANLQ